MNNQSPELVGEAEVEVHGITRRKVLQLIGGAAGAAGMTTTFAPADFALASNTILFQSDAQSLVVGVQAVPAISNVGNRVLYSIYDHLIETDFAAGDPPGTGSELVPMLATGWRRVDDLTLEVRLRENVLFHNNEVMTAEDVKFSIERMAAKDAPEEIANARVFVSTINSIEVVDDVTLRITTAEPDPVLEQRLGAMPCWILPKAYFEEVGMEGFGQAPIGTGPFKFVELRPDDRLVLEVFDEYWDGPPPVSGVTFRVIPETATRVAAVAGDEVQIITNIPPDQVSTLQSTDGVEVHQVPLANYHVLVFNTNHPVLADKRLRQALRLGIDRKLLVDTLWGGDALLTRSAQVEAWGNLYNPDRPFMEYDPDQARQLIEESGYNGQTILYTTATTYYTFGAEAGQAIVSMWQDLGLTAEFENREDAFAAPPEEIMVRTWSNGTFPGDPDGSFWRNWGEGTPPQRNFWTPENPRFNELGIAARQTLDQDFRYEAYQEMLDIWEEESPGTVLYVPIENYAVRQNVSWLPYSFWYMDFRADNIRIE
jgi:peptide/nickel transport system substrate-binding protein